MPGQEVTPITMTMLSRFQRKPLAKAVPPSVSRPGFDVAVFAQCDGEVLVVTTTPAMVFPAEMRPEMLTALRRCHEHEAVATALLTNNFVGLSGRNSNGDGLMGRVLDLFDVVVESSRAGVRKPDPAIYRLVCDELGVEPAEAVFLDDLGINLKPARALGMTTIKVVDPAGALAQLEAVVGFPLS